MPALIVLLILIALAALGVLGFIVKVAFAVALGVFLALVGVAAYAMWRIRRAWRRAIAGSPGSSRRFPAAGRASAPRMRGHSQVTVLSRDEPESRPTS